MLDFLKASLKTGGGLAVVAAALFYSMHVEWLKIGMFSAMTPDQTYKAFLYSLGATVVIALMLMLIHASSNKKASISISARDNANAVNNSGSGTVNINKDK
ncbi:hypothetical protein [Pseudomonas sp. PMCC200344]|uniref:hypothetical protein n=1 Tax=Pseudomonas TaxID=286 RepID=UPI0024B34CC9|nr:hypothetical protein [Pseudomonas sp. PMCC200344]